MGAESGSRSSATPSSSLCNSAARTGGMAGHRSTSSCPNLRMARAGHAPRSARLCYADATGKADGLQMEAGRI